MRAYRELDQWFLAPSGEGNPLWAGKKDGGAHDDLHSCDSLRQLKVAQTYTCAWLFCIGQKQSLHQSKAGAGQKAKPASKQGLCGEKKKKKTYLSSKRSTFFLQWQQGSAEQRNEEKVLGKRLHRPSGVRRPHLRTTELDKCKWQSRREPEGTAGKGN